MPPRSATMFGSPGVSYVYLIYGLYYCLNIVAEEEGTAADVLIRGVQLTIAPFAPINGPRRLCRFFGITTDHNGLSLLNTSSFYVTEGESPLRIRATPRIGITKGQEKVWRFIRSS